ncbi:hypothetical protein [Oceanobacillus sp. FSL H7-0719]
MRRKIVDYFIGEPEEITLSQEITFYGIMSSPILLFIIILILV